MTIVQPLFQDPLKGLNAERTGYDRRVVPERLVKLARAMQHDIPGRSLAAGSVGEHHQADIRQNGKACLVGQWQPAYKLSGQQRKISDIRYLVLSAEC